MPAALEMMDREIIRAVEASIFAAGLPPDAGAALLIELDGIEAGLDDEAEKVANICMEYGARNCRYARDEVERKKLWAARKGAFGAIGRITPDSMIQDAVVPRSRLPEVLGAAYDIAARYQLRIANVFHAGDGNLHPLICFDSRFPEEVLRVREAGRELMEVCVRAGGTITGEHGVGLDKRELLPLVFTEADMNAMLSVRAAFDPLGLCNPGKIVPMLRGCGEAKAIATEPGTGRRGDGETHFKAGQGTDYALAHLTSVIGDTRVSVKSVSSLVVTPASTEELAEIIKLAATERWTITPAGGMTLLENNPATNLIINTSRLDKIIEHEPADLIAIAQAGVKLTDFNQKLSENGQWLPLDPPDDGRATLGGVVATGLGGAQQFGYGRPRGSVIGMKVVMADGNVIKAGGRVVKNVAGYDLCKLFTGSYGSLGVTAELIFKLRPRPARETTVLSTGPTNELLSIGRTLRDAQLFPVALELVSSAFANRLGINTAPDAAALLVRFAGNEKGVGYQIEETLIRLKNSAARSIQVLTDDAAFWQKVAAMPLREKPSFATRVLPTMLPESIRSLDGHSLWQAGVADGRIRVMNQAIAKADPPGLLDQRVKQQLDPLNLFRGNQDEHAP
jgi:FAD/FMN-containing dehydrogenase